MASETEGWAFAKLWFEVVLGDSDAQPVVDVVINVQIRPDVYEALEQGRGRIRNFRVIGES